MVDHTGTGQCTDVYRLLMDREQRCAQRAVAMRMLATCGRTMSWLRAILDYLVHL